MQRRFASVRWPVVLVFTGIAVLRLLPGIGSSPEGRSCVGPAAAWAGEAQDLGRARQLLNGILEGHVREGTAICVRLNSVKSVKLLIEVLRRTKRRALAAAHYRDIVWDGFLRITDPYAREKVAKLARKDKNAWVRQWAVELIGLWGDREFAGYAVGACRDRHRWVRQWAARSLGLLRHTSPEAEEALLKLTADKSPYVRANAIEALAQIDAKKHSILFHKALLEEPDGGARCALLGAVPGVYNAEVVALSTAALKDTDWRPRMQAVDNLNRPTKKAVDGLVVAAKDGRPIVADRAMRYLRKLTEKEIRDGDAWTGWWKTHREKFAFPEGEQTDGDESKKKKAKGERKTVSFNDIPLVSDHVGFLIDKSIRMKAPLKSKKQMPKFQAATEELNQVLGKLHGRLVFNVYCYRDEVVVFQKRPVALDEKQQKRAIAFVGKQKNKNAKDIWKVLELVVSDPDIDTAYLLSSGEPDIGLYVHWNRVTRHLRELNRFHKVTIHTVVYSGRKWYRDQLERIAQATQGQFKWFE